ncbi:MAG: hypothetical protein ABL958_20580, partial [Bdellovibrionia bacterium]
INPVSFKSGAEGTHFPCGICGQFNASERFLTYHHRGLEDSHIYSGALREQNLRGNTTYLLNEPEELLHSVSVPRNPIEQIDKLLLAIEQLAAYFGEAIPINYNTHYPYAYARHGAELHQLAINAGQAGKAYVLTSGTFPTDSIRLLIGGSERLVKIHEGDVNSRQAFVAMWFDSETKDAWENGIRPALEQTKYDPRRIDLKEHNNKIDDEIVAEIRKSGLVVADFTGNRAGVYYEAGFAKGLGIPVIWTCKKDHLKNVHFDTRQYNHIDWETPEELKERLIHRIEAEIPRIS